MDAQNIALPSNYSQLIVFIFTLNCDFCGEFRSRKGALIAEVRGVSRFVCAACCVRAGASCYEDIFGRADWSVLDLIFPEGGPA